MYGKFQPEIRSNKKINAKKPLTNLYKMNSTFFTNSYMIEHETYLIRTNILSKFEKNWVKYLAERALTRFY